MDMTLIPGTIAGLKLAGDMAKGLLELKSIGDVQGKVIELQSVILSAQSSALAAIADQFAMVEEIRTLKEEIARFEAWEAQKKRYKLTQLWDGAAVAYALKKSESAGEPPHLICAACYEKRMRMCLQPFMKTNGRMSLVCPSCKAELYFGGRGISPATYAEE